MPAKKIATSSSAKAYNPNAYWYKPRLSETGDKVRRVIAVGYIEDLEKDGHTYYDLLGYIDSLMIKAVVSPIHDRDFFTSSDVLAWCTRHIDPETGDLDEKYIDDAPFVGKSKKPHVHIGIMISAQQPASYFTELFKGFLHIRPSMWDKMEDYEGFVKYCAHMCSPEKAQYSPFDVMSFGGADLSCLTKQDETESLQNWADCIRFVKTNRISSFAKLVDESVTSGDFYMQRAVKANGALLASYFNSKNNERYWRHKLKDEGRDVDPLLLGMINDMLESYRLLQAAGEYESADETVRTTTKK